MAFYHITSSVLWCALLILIAIVLGALVTAVTRGESPDPDEEIQRILRKEDHEITKH